MKQLLFSTLCISVVCGVVISTPIVHAAANESVLVQTFLKDALAAADTNDPTTALTYFCRALLLDPQNDIAKRNILNLVSDTALSALQRLHVVRLEDLLVTLQRVQEQVDYYVLKRNALGKELIGYGYDAQWLDNQMDTIKQNVIDNPPAVWATGNTEASAADSDPLIAVTQMLSAQQHQLRITVAYLSEQYTWLRQLNQENKYFIPMVVVYEGGAPISDIARSPDGASEAMKIKTELAQLRQQMLILEARVQQKDLTVADLTDQIVDISLQLTEQTNTLTQKDDAVAAMQTQMQEMDSRIELGQKIVQEKESHIESLKKDLAYVQDEQGMLKEQMAERDMMITEISGMLDIYKNKLGEVAEEVKVRMADVVTLEEQLAFAQKQLFHKDKLITQTHADMLTIQVQLDKINEQLKNIQSGPLTLDSPLRADAYHQIEQLYAQLQRMQAFVAQELSAANSSESLP